MQVNNRRAAQGRPVGRAVAAAAEHEDYDEEEERAARRPASPPARAAGAAGGGGGTKRGRASIVSRATLARRQPMIQRLLALLIFGVSLVGALLWGGGGAERWLALSPLWIGVIATFVVQAICTGVQWVFCSDWYNPYYLIALGVSTLTTVLGYWPLTHGALSAMIEQMAGEAAVGYYAGWIAGAVITLAAILTDILPEKILTS